MTETGNRIEAVPTNIITGFLGVGKTSAILHLLKSKPVNERWAVLVNEFGEIGVDGSLFQGQHVLCRRSTNANCSQSITCAR
jgi:G3E family GTPase